MYFWFAILVNEIVQTYKRVLENFLYVMRNKHPSVLVTDGDEVMREAIKAVFPETTHQLCVWHFQKNVTANIKDLEFCAVFKKCIYANFDCDEFEEY